MAHVKKLTKGLITTHRGIKKLVVSSEKNKDYNYFDRRLATAIGGKANMEFTY